MCWRPLLQAQRTLLLSHPVPSPGFSLPVLEVLEQPAAPESGLADSTTPDEQIAHPLQEVH